MRKILIPTQGDFVAPRFDLATELLIAVIKDGELLEKPKTIIMERPSEEEICQMIIGENISELICGGIDEVHYNFLVWKKVKIHDSVIGDWESVLQLTVEDSISPGAIIPPKKDSKLIL